MSSQPVLGASQAVATPYPDSPWVVLKFGGRSVSTAENWAIIAKLIRERLDEGVRPVVVHSALVGVSNALIALLDAAAAGGDTDERLAKIRAQHDALAKSLGVDAALLDERDGFIENTTAKIIDTAPDKIKDRKRTGVRLTTEAPDVWGTRVLLSYENAQMYDGGTGLETILAGPNFQAAVRNYDPGADFIKGNWIASMDRNDYKDVSIRRGRFQLERSFWDWDVIALGSHALMEQTVSIDTDFTPANAIPGSGRDRSVVRSTCRSRPA